MNWFKIIWWHLTHSTFKRELHRGSQSFRCIADVVTFKREPFGPWVETSRRGIHGYRMDSDDADILRRDGKVDWL